MRKSQEPNPRDVQLCTVRVCHRTLLIQDVAASELAHGHGHGVFICSVEKGMPHMSLSRSRGIYLLGREGHATHVTVTVTGYLFAR